MRNVFVFARTSRHNAQWCLNLHPSNQPLFTQADVNEIQRFENPKIIIKTFTVETVGTLIKGPLIVRRDDDCLYLSDDLPTDRDLQRNIILDDASLWEAYEAACQVKAKAETAVIKNLRKPTHAEIQWPPTPTPVELGALACLYVAERLRASRKPDPGIVALARAHTTAGASEISEVPQSKEVLTHNNEELFTINWSAAVSSEMARILHSKDWLSHVGNGVFTISWRAQQWLDKALKETP